MFSKKSLILLAGIRLSPELRATKRKNRDLAVVEGGGKELTPVSE